MIAVGLAVVCLALTPVARALAGQQTVLNVSITLAISITLAVTLAMTGVWGHKQKKRADGAEDALQRCQHEAVDTVKEAKDAKERVEMLQLELADVRAELRVMAKGT
ncbi:hypothetical protein A5N74_12180 [Prescottella equi]|nr:hypothetical protein A5N74_12180 [Prescottella equi]